MNKWFAIAAGMVVVLAVAHFLGGVPRFQSVAAPDNPVPDISGITIAVWFAVSILLVINAAILIGAALNKAWGKAGLVMIAGQILGFVALFMFYGAGLAGNQINPLIWASVFAIPAAIYLGQRSARLRET